MKPEETGDTEKDLPEEEDFELEGCESDSAPTVRMHITIDKRQEPLRIDKFIMIRLEGATRNKIQQALDEGFVLVNGAQVKANYKVRPGDEVLIYETRKAENLEVVPEQMPLNIVYEDDDLMIINKPDGMVVHPGSGNYSGTLVNGLAYYLKDAIADDLPRVGLVHRIDKDTTGLLVVGKTEHAIAHLSAQFKKHTVHRRYLALVWGDLPEEEGTIVAHVGRHQRFRKLMTAYPEGEHGKEAITHYKVLERFGYVTLAQLQLETGRTHQIRVHMQYIGHPLFNDATYGGNRIVKGTVFTKYRQFVENAFQLIPRHALHAKELGFIHPATGIEMHFDSLLPEDMKSVIEKWKGYTAALKFQ